MTPPAVDILSGVEVLLTDVDGVLTDGRVHFDSTGREVKSFHVHDAAGIAYWHRAGGISGFLSGRDADIVRERATELGVHEVHLGRLDKAAVLEEILNRRRVSAERVAYVGDDLLDIPVLERVAFAVAPPNARAEVKERVHHVTATPGGFGAVRDVVEILLRARGAWDDVVRRRGRP